MTGEVPILEARGLTKRFGGTVALADVDLVIEPGSVHALVGENGAGKSTLAKTLGGLQRPDEGEILLDGQGVSFRDPADALRGGVALISQELALVPGRSVIENVFLGAEERRFGVVQRKVLRARFDALVAETGIDVPAGRLVRELRPPDKLKTEVLRALARDARLIILDEPTAYLMREDARHLLDAVEALRERGMSFVYVSHFLEEVLELADVVTVLRDGVRVSTAPASTFTPASLVKDMTGREVDLTFPEKRPPASDAPVVLHVEHLRSAPVLQDVSLTVRAGEIVGLAGLVGSGRTEFARAVFGADPASAGHVSVAGERVDPRHPSTAMAARVAMIPESRGDALWMNASVRLNAGMGSAAEFSRWGVLSLRRETAALTPALDEVKVDGRQLESPVGLLSGGNQQKVIFSKWLRQRPQVLIADEPTRGIDVATKAEIYALLAGLAREGMAIVVISSEIEELIGLAHRILVMRAGQVVREMDGTNTSPEELLEAAFTDNRSSKEMVA